MAYPITNGRNSFPSMDVERPLTTGEKTELMGNGVLVDLQLPTPYTFATEDKIVLGSDLRLGLKGGINLAGANADGAGHGVACSLALTDFEFIFTVVPRWSSPRNAWLIGCDSFMAGFGNNGTSDIWTEATVTLLYSGGYYTAQLGTGTPFGNLVGKPICVCIKRVAGIVSIGINGTYLLSSTVALAGSINRIFGGYYGGYGQFQGDVLSVAMYNRELTGTERSAVTRGETPVGLAGPGVKLSGNLTNGSGGLAAFESVTDASIAGFALTATSAGVHGAGSPISVPVGGSVRVSGTSQSWSGVVSVALLNGATVVSQHVIAQNGPWSAVLNATTAVTQIAVLINGVGSVWSTDNVFEVLGTVARYEPLDITPSTTWVDTSGNCLDIKPAVGVTALGPTKAFTRVVSASTVDTLAPGDGVESVVATTLTTPVSISTGDAVVASFTTTDLPEGLHCKRVRATGTNTVVMLVTNLNGSSEQTGVVPFKLIQTIN